MTLTLTTRKWSATKLRTLRLDSAQRQAAKRGWPTGLCLAVQHWTRKPCTKPRGHHGSHEHDPATWERRT